MAPPFYWPGQGYGGRNDRFREGPETPRKPVNTMHYTALATGSNPRFVFPKLMNIPAMPNANY